VPDHRTRHLPEASQNATPNLIAGTAVTSASWMSSTVLMKWDCPRMKFVVSGLSILTVVSCIRAPPLSDLNPSRLIYHSRWLTWPERRRNDSGRGVLECAGLSALPNRDGPATEYRSHPRGQPGLGRARLLRRRDAARRSHAPYRRACDRGTAAFPLPRRGE